jgi:hypothetical protein
MLQPHGERIPQFDCNTGRTLVFAPPPLTPAFDLGFWQIIAGRQPSIALDDPIVPLQEGQFQSRIGPPLAPLEWLIFAGVWNRGVLQEPVIMPCRRAIANWRNSVQMAWRVYFRSNVASRCPTWTWRVRSATGLRQRHPSTKKILQKRLTIPQKER